MREIPLWCSLAFTFTIWAREVLPIQVDFFFQPIFGLFDAINDSFRYLECFLSALGPK